MSVLDGLKGYYRLFGPKGVFLTAKSRLLGIPIEVQVDAPGMSHPVHLRLRTTDVSLFSEIVLHSEYAWQFSKTPRTIVDVGANIGLSPAYFANRFPQATVLAVEPVASNFEMLLKNTAAYSNVVPVQAALWKENADLDLVDPGLGAWGFQTIAHKNNQPVAKRKLVPGMTLDKLMADHGIDYIDILKIDIEGAEKEVFENCASWVDKVGVIIIELHDRFREGCSRQFYLATPDFPVEWHRGELTVLAKKEYGAVDIPHTGEGNKRLPLPCRIIQDQQVPVRETYVTGA